MTLALARAFVEVALGVLRKMVALLLTFAFGLRGSGAGIGGSLCLTGDPGLEALRDGGRGLGGAEAVY